ncbi:MAG: FliI/YscN family ATPase [Bdellovibrionales bacterium]|nr:FliI/YscN family ATPase [Bdellovibrionales bacterium]
MSEAGAWLSELGRDLPSLQTHAYRGKVTAVNGSGVTCLLQHAAVRDLVRLNTRSGEPLLAEVISLQGQHALVAPFGEVDDIVVGASVELERGRLAAQFYAEEFGLVVDSLGVPLHGSQKPRGPATSLPIFESAPAPLSRVPLSSQIVTGITAIDALHPIARGQRIGLFAPAGLGKSTLLGALARAEQFDVVVVALVGERGKEVGEFVHEALGEEGMKRAVVVVSTSDEVPAMRRLAPFTATAIAEFYREKSLSVLLLVDSLTRTARAVRDLSLAAGESPVRQGYTSSVYEQLPRLVERAGNSRNGSITALYTVLTQSVQELDPLVDEVKSLLDGHFILSQAIAELGIRPAIDPGSSVSRVTEKILSRECFAEVSEVKRIFQQHLAESGVFASLTGKSTEDDQLGDALRRVFSQGISERRTLDESFRKLGELKMKKYSGKRAIQPESAVLSDRSRNS